MRARQGARGFVAGRVLWRTQPKQNASATQYCEVYTALSNKKGVHLGHLLLLRLLSL